MLRTRLNIKVEIVKYDYELQASEAMGGTSLEGTGFSIYNDSEHPIVYPGPSASADIPRREVSPGHFITEIFASWDEALGAYVARTGIDDLPFGSYIIRETTRTEYYLIPHPTTGVRFEARFEIREHEEMVRHFTESNVENEDGVLRAFNQSIRNDIQFNKMGEVNNQRLAYVPFLVTNRATGEAHVIITDINGVFRSDSSWFEPGYRTPETTNQNNHLLEYVERGEIIPVSSMNLYTHVWFGTGEFGTVAPIHPYWGAFHAGWYDIVELRTESNQHYEMLEVEFYVSRHLTHNREIYLGTLTNHFSRDQHIRTVARANDTFSRLFPRGHTFVAHDQITAWHSNIPPLQLSPEYHIDAFLYVVEPDTEPRRIHEFDRITYTLRDHTNTFNIEWEVDHSEFDDDAWFFFAAEMFNAAGESIYQHNFNGDIDAQSLRPLDPTPPPVDVEITTVATTSAGENTFISGAMINAIDTITVWHSDVAQATDLQLGLDVRLHVVELDADGNELPARVIYEFDRIAYQIRDNYMEFGEADGIILDVDTSEFSHMAWFFFSAESVDLATGAVLYTHNLEGDDPNQTLHPRYAFISTQAWVGREGNQYFYYPLRQELQVHDDIRITHVHIAPGTPMAFRPVLNVMRLDGTIEVLWTGDYVDYTVGNILSRNHNDSITMEFTESTYISPDTLGEFQFLFWSEYLYRVVENENGQDERILVYEHNKNGQDENQTLIPVVRPTNQPEPAPDVPNLPRTGATTSRMMFILGTGALGTGVGAVAWKHKLVKRNKPIKIG